MNYFFRPFSFKMNFKWKSQWQHQLMLNLTEFSLLWDEAERKNGKAENNESFSSPLNFCFPSALSFSSGFWWVSELEKISFPFISFEKNYLRRIYNRLEIKWNAKARVMWNYLLFAFHIPQHESASGHCRLHENGQFPLCNLKLQLIETFLRFFSGLAISTRK